MKTIKPYVVQDGNVPSEKMVEFFRSYGGSPCGRVACCVPENCYHVNNLGRIDSSLSQEKLEEWGYQEFRYSPRSGSFFEYNNKKNYGLKRRVRFAKSNSGRICLAFGFASATDASAEIPVNEIKVPIDMIKGGAIVFIPTSEE